mmetsp:Transcript_8146/g.13031  ORF Transcript_8146/g.13031 Transcript_8146/m.13031 type:complete len:103 (+) Transcript_8146:17-325(+)
MAGRLEFVHCDWKEGKTLQEQEAFLNRGVRGCIEEAAILGNFCAQQRQRGRDFEKIYADIEKALQSKSSSIPSDDAVKKEDLPKLNPDELWKEWQEFEENDQ